MTLTYGMLCEGDSDLYTIEIICKRLAELHGDDVSLVKELSEPVSGPVTKLNVKSKTRQFMAGSVDFGLYIADFDKGVIDKQALIVEGITSVNQMWFEKSVIGVPSPHLEEWLLADEDFIKNYLALDATRPLPHPRELPKDRLQALVSQNGPAELTTGEFRRIIATDMNIDIVLRKSQSFSLFSKSLNTVLNHLSSI